MSINNGGPAFPAQHFDLADHEHGMSLRDWFAGQALIETCNHYMPQSAALKAYEFADEMLKAREVQS